MPRQVSPKRFINKATALHNHKYDYSQVQYKNNTTKVSILCSLHGEFLQTPHNHLSGHGCPICGYKESTKKRAFDTEKFIQQAQAIHQGKYDYSQVCYTNNSNKISILCPQHGAFTMRPYSHLAGQGCPKCAIAKRRSSHLYTQKDFVRLSQAAHGTKYDYSKSQYKLAHEPIIIVCPEHGEFRQAPSNHWLGQGCPKCRNKKNAENRTYSTEEFIDLAKKVHGNTYNYTKSKYENSQIPMKILCQNHGEFWQRPNSHLSGQGCPKCGSTESKDEQAIYDFLISIGITDIQSRIRNIIPPKELDIYSPSHKIAIEYCGLYWHSDAQKSSNYHLDKLKACQEKGIRLITIFESDWKLKRLIVESRLRAIFGKTEQTIYARKTNIKELTSSEAREFFSQNHLQGNAPNQSVVYGLYHAGKLVSAMSFGKPRFSKNHEWEILRYASALNTSVVGSASKLYMHFVKRHNPSTVISYADLRWGKGDVYKNMGFSESGSSRPNYFYFKSPEIHLYSRIKFQKYRLPKILEDYNETLTEKQNMQNNGWFRIFDCGNVKFTWSTFPTQ